jgi:bifunctional non-homologous end joining protein LigD
MSPASEKVPVDIEGHRLTLSNLQKVLYPQTGFAKGQMLDYYTRISPVLLPHLRDRPLTRKRYPDGVEGLSFFEKNAPSHRPEWVRTATVASPGSTRNRETIDYIVCDDLPTLVWLANLAALELHTPMWRVGTGLPDMTVVDLDPGPPATIVECCRVALAVRDATGLDWYAKTSGSKGLQLYTPVRDGRTSEQTSAEMKALAERLEKENPELVVSRMTKAIRPGKVLLDWSQNNSAKTTVSVYSLRARPEQTVSTPVTWEEVEACAAPEDLVFRTHDVLDRVEAHGDLFAPLLP